MLPLLTWIILFCLVGGVLSVLFASLLLLISDEQRGLLIPHFVSFAIGTLLGAAFLGLLPHALAFPQISDAHSVMVAVLIGLLAFFLLEKLVLWRHCHSAHCEAHAIESHSTPDHDHHHAKVVIDSSSSGSLIVIGDILHSFVDGVLIAAAFMTDILLGVVTSLAIAAHEIPQQISNFIVLLQGGRKTKKAFVFNLFSSIGTVVGGIVGYYSLSDMQHILPFILAVAASSFIYIAVADLIPGLHQRAGAKEIMQQMILIVFGVVLIYFSHTFLH